MYIEPCFPFVNFVGLDMTLAFHGPHGRKNSSSTWHFWSWYQFPMLSSFMIAHLLLHCLKEELCLVGCMQCLVIVHGFRIGFHCKGKWILQLLLYFVVSNLPNAVPGLTNECNIMAKSFWWSDDPSSGLCGAWLDAWLSTGHSAVMIQTSCSTSHRHLALVCNTLVCVCLCLFMVHWAVPVVSKVSLLLTSGIWVLHIVGCQLCSQFFLGVSDNFPSLSDLHFLICQLVPLDEIEVINMHWALVVLVPLDWVHLLQNLLPCAHEFLLRPCSQSWRGCQILHET